MDNDDCIKMRTLARDFDDRSNLLCNVLQLKADIELMLDMGIIDENISDKLSWKKNVIELIKKNDSYKQVYIDYCKQVASIKVCQTKLKSIENEINILKKTYEETPR